ncbi:hypothetical protein [Vulcanisaeta moutnovskia]|uniref:hypothetical protein n=1 Tax=Vulcanisaeta moutnovskia TaxID=985052 RepID=UPI00064FE463|nr:hypothetical protein [Vulcanisaeta moutnovskia]
MELPEALVEALRRRGLDIDYVIDALVVRKDLVNRCRFTCKSNLINIYLSLRNQINIVSLILI